MTVNVRDARIKLLHMLDRSDLKHLATCENMHNMSSHELQMYLLENWTEDIDDYIENKVNSLVNVSVHGTT